MPWSLEEQQWAKDTLGVDAGLDTQAETTHPSQAAYYATWASRWTTTRHDVLTLEAGVRLSPDQYTQPPQWFALAIVAHQYDTTINPQNKWWNDEWIANYQRLERDWSQLAT